MNRSTTKWPYTIVIVISAIFIVWTIIHNFISDPNAASFLSHKTHISHPLHVHPWLTVLRIHIVFACLAMITGLVNFSTKVLRNNRRLHRVNGYTYIVCVVVVSITSGYMAPTATGGEMNSAAFNLISILWVIATATAFIHIKKKRIASHRRWMVRSYTFCFTNLLIHVLMFVCSSMAGMAYDLSYTISVYGSIVFNIAISSTVVRIWFTRSRQIDTIDIIQST